LTPIADGCPNLDILECEAFNCPTDEICYLLERKKRQLMTYDHYGPVTDNLFAAINECTNLKRLSFTSVEIYGLFNEAPSVMKLQNLKALWISDCRFPAVKIIPLTLFHTTLHHLSYIGIPHTNGNINAVTNKILLRCPLLTHLDLDGNELHCRGLRNIGSCKMLKYLDVSDCPKLGKKAMKYVAEGCPELQHLDISYNPIWVSMFRQILRCRNLKELLMRNCDLRPINLGSISTHIDGLLYLYIGPHFQLPHDVRYQLEQQMPQLVITESSVTWDDSQYLRMKTEFLSRYF
jgi:Leucine-rich repeat (LRR) protein